MLSLGNKIGDLWQFRIWFLWYSSFSYEEVGNSVVQLMNALPPSREVASQKGSAPTAEELATKREIMREESWHFLDHYVNVGTLAYVVLKKEKASDLASTHNDLMVCVGMRQGCPLWEHPDHGIECACI